MNKNILISSLLVIIILNIAGCEKNDPYAFEVRINLVDESGKETNVFENGDSIIFKFYLTNNSGDDALFERPCYEFSNFLNIYKEDTKGVYQYYGKPSFRQAHRPERGIKCGFRKGNQLWRRTHRKKGRIWMATIPVSIRPRTTK